LREVVIAGEGRDRAVALVWPDFGACRAALHLGVERNLGVELTDSDLTRHPAVLDALTDRLTAFNDGQTASTSAQGRGHGRKLGGRAPMPRALRAPRKA
jgi:hypothetical protein